ncbi:MAG: non-ribosomal peptide synthetase, partial [Acidobacteria bacterium]|nr:non-ribosomal peptide synthetase [Acidobacteriota bacterium]
RGFRIELGEIEAVLDEHPAIRQAVVVVRTDDPSNPRLAAYLVPKGKELPNVSELRDFLQKKVPEYMVPALFMPMTELPLTPNGKVDRKALPKPDPKLLGGGKEYVAPRTPEEEALAAIWAEVLKLEKVGVLDDFFELGGDSLQVIRVVAKAKKADLALTTKQVFQNRTVEQLAKVVGASQVLAEQGPISGVIPMSPAQKHFLGLGHTRPELHCLGAELVTKDGKPFDEEALRGALTRLIEQHDTLRMHLEPRAAGEAGGERVLIGEAKLDPLPFARIDTSDLRALDERERWRQETFRIWDFAAEFDLDHGPLFRAGLFDPGPGEPQTLMLLGHFLVADIGSWQVILDDFDTLYRQLSSGGEMKLPAKTTAFKQWIERLTQRADSDAMRPERAYWLKEERKTTARMPFDFPDGANQMKSAKSAGVELDEEQTAALLQKLPRATGTLIDAILLTSVLYAFDEWTGCNSLLIDLLGHGREPLFDDVDLTRTVGWLNTIFPAYLTLGDSRDPITALKFVNQQLRDIPHGGIGYGILRYLSRDPEVAARFDALPESQIFFNYFGPDHATELTTLKKVDGFAGYGADHETHRLRPLAIGVYVQEDRMLIKWEYSTNLHRHETIEAVAESARRVLLKLIESMPQTA